MADVTEVIHKISYEVNDEALNNATKAIHAQIAEFDRLGKQLGTYSKQIEKLSAKQHKEFDELSRKIVSVGMKMDVELHKSEGLLKQFGKGVLKGLDISKDVESFAAKITGPLKSELDSFSKSGSFSFKNIGKSILTFNTALDLGINLLKIIAEEIFTVDGALNGLSVTEKNAIKIKETAIGMYVDEQVKLQLLNREVLDEQTSKERLKEIRDELVSSYPSLAQNLAGEANLRLKLADAIYKTNDALVLQSRVRAAEELLIEEQKGYLSNRIDAWGFIKGSFYSIGGTSFGIAKMATDKVKEHTETVNDLLKVIEEGKAELKNSGLEQILEDKIVVPQITYAPKVKKPETEEEKPVLKLKIETEYDEKEIERQVQEIKTASERKIKELHDSAIKGNDDDELNDLIGLEERYKNDKLTFEEYEKEKLEIADRYKELRLEKELEYLQSLQLVYQQDAEKREALLLKQKETELELKRLQNKKNNTDDENEEEKAAELRKQRRQEAISEFQNLAEAAVEAYNTISEAQIKALDKEISIREKRVENARKLAERGNAEALRLEEERLEEAQRKRDQIAKRQASVNAALAVSNSLVAVTGAIASAVKGDGYSLAARVAAAIAAVLGALSAGYAFVQSFSDDADSFATGVVDYKGKGGPRDDSNWVRISSGESVITAEGTQKNRALLEAINNGTAFQMLDTSLPLLMPSFKQPSVVNHNYATTQEMKGLEHKLDDVVNAIEDNKLRQNIFFNEQGVGIMTERAMNRNRKRWM